MNIRATIRGVIAAVLLFGAVSVAQANIIYNLNRVIGAGTVTGFLETDGTIGALNAGNIVNWSVTIFAPNINGGAPTTGTTGSPSLFFGLSATATDILFDFGSSDITIVWNNAFTDWWCLAGSIAGCFVPNAETIGYDDGIFGHAQAVSYRGVQSIANAVPEPGSLALVLLAAGLLGARRRNV